MKIIGSSSRITSVVRDWAKMSFEFDHFNPSNSDTSHQKRPITNSKKAKVNKVGPSVSVLGVRNSSRVISPS